jgi:hypothetical protein
MSLTAVKKKSPQLALEDILRGITVGEMKSFKPPTSVPSYQVIRDSMVMQRFVDAQVINPEIY